MEIEDKTEKEKDRNPNDFCRCGQIKHVGFDKCLSCIEEENKSWLSKPTYDSR